MARRKYRRRKVNILGFLVTLVLVTLLIFLVLKNMTTIFDDYFKSEAGAFQIEMADEVPSGLWGEAISEEEINISWDNTIEADYYYLYFTNDESGFWETIRDENEIKVKLDWHEGIMHKFTNLVPGTKLYVKIQGVKNGIKTEYSDSISVETFAGIKTILMDRPPFRKYRDENLEDIEPQYIELEKASEKENQIEDYDKWFTENELVLNEYTIPEDINDMGDMPEYIKREYKALSLVKAIKDTEYILLIYGEDINTGRYLLVLDKDTGERIHSLDFKDYAYATRYDIGRANEVYQGIRWAQIENGILYISHAQDSYAKYSFYMTGFITAIDLSDMHILWRTYQRVADSYNFVIHNDIIISGYGYTYEDDFLYLINKYNGGFYREIKIKTMAIYLITKGNRLYVRSYDTDYLFEIINKY